ncbi:MAG: secretin and TonB N-terminal domain-containing protein [Candidatus Omnitrophica bacterium]|nr:secretin and TonB N-terminal domain-containing protein [Candidatus Omnitrophota bacterium]
MVFYRMSLLLWTLVVSASFCRAATQDNDIESRFIYPEYSKKVSMDFKDASLTDVLKIFSRQAGMNFIAAQDVSGKKVTLFLDNIPVEDALGKILEANDLTYEMAPGSDVFIVKAKPKGQMMTKVFPLKYATVFSSKLNSTITIAAGSSSSGSSASSLSSGGIMAAVKTVLSKDGKMVEDPRTNSLMITDAPEQFPLIEETIAKLDVPVLQILIEVEMLDVSKSTGDKLGINFSSLGGSFAPLTITEAAKATWSHDKTMKVMTNNFSNAYDMTAVLDFSRQQTDTRTLARPRILTLNNQSAEIKISTNEAISIQSIQASTGSTSSQTAVTPERAQTGVFLTVTPQANLLTGEILMAVYPKVIQASASTLKLPAGASPIKDTEERGSQSILKVKNGETIALGGLLREETSNTIDKLPILGDIPLLGAAFRHKDKSTEERELIIFITPYILNDKVKEKFDSKAALHFNREVNRPVDLNTVSQQLNSMEKSKP